LNSTGHDYDFVGIIESKHDSPITYFFEDFDVGGLSEEHYMSDYDKERDLDESKCKLRIEYYGIDEENEDDENEITDTFLSIGNCSYFTLKPFETTGFLSDCKQRGWFLALIKRYCPERLKDIPWA
jgi:hypothetical protein